MKNVIIQSKKKDFGDISFFLKENFGFLEIGEDRNMVGFLSKWRRILMIFSDAIFVIKKRAELSGSNLLFSSGFISFFIRLFIKFGLIQCNTFIWIGLLIHSERSFKIHKVLLKLTKIKDEKFTVSSKCEIDLYSKKLGIPKSCFIYIPLGDYIEREFTQVETEVDGEYYFAGGYSNRNYAPLINVFRKLPQKLVIVGSHLNEELNLNDVPENIIIYQDIDKNLFEILVRNSKACILPLKKDTGASGQRVINSYLRNGKTVIAKDMCMTREYFSHSVNGFLYKHTEPELLSLINTIENNPDLLVKTNRNTVDFYNSELTKKALFHHYDHLVKKYSKAYKTEA